MRQLTRSVLNPHRTGWRMPSALLCRRIGCARIASQPWGVFVNNINDLRSRRPPE
jgi:hypothetical protein